MSSNLFKNIQTYCNIIYSYVRIDIAIWLLGGLVGNNYLGKLVKQV